MIDHITPVGGGRSFARGVRAAPENGSAPTCRA